VHSDSAALVGGKAAPEAVAPVALMIGDVELGGERATRVDDAHVNMRCAARIGDRLDGAEAILAIRIGDANTKALEVWIAVGMSSAVTSV
jgi:hypothetical protein